MSTSISEATVGGSVDNGIVQAGRENELQTAKRLMTGGKFNKQSSQFVKGYEELAFQLQLDLSRDELRAYFEAENDPECHHDKTVA